MEKRGRKPTGKARLTIVGTRVRPDELNIVHRMARDAGISVSELIRRRLGLKPSPIQAW